MQNQTPRKPLASVSTQAIERLLIRGMTVSGNIKLLHLRRDVSIVQDVVVGTYYIVTLGAYGQKSDGVGKQPRCAVRNALEKLEVLLEAGIPVQPDKEDTQDVIDSPHIEDSIYRGFDALPATYVKMRGPLNIRTSERLPELLVWMSDYDMWRGGNVGRGKDVVYAAPPDSLVVRDNKDAVAAYRAKPHCDDGSPLSEAERLPDLPFFDDAPHPPRLPEGKRRWVFRGRATSRVECAGRVIYMLDEGGWNKAHLVLSGQRYIEAI